MARYNLTESQMDLLRTIVENIKAGKLEEPLIPVSSMAGDSIIGLEQELGPNLLGKLEALCDLDLLGFRYNSQGNKVFTVKQAGYDAVTSDFMLPEPSPQAQVNIGAIIHQMEGGSLQAIGFADHAEVQRIANDPALLENKLVELTNNLLEAVKSDLCVIRPIPTTDSGVFRPPIPVYSDH